MNQISILHLVEQYDLKRRHEILTSELTHFLNSISYRRGLSYKEIKKEIKNDNSNHSSLNGLFKRLLNSGETLQRELDNDIKERKAFEVWFQAKNEDKFSRYFSLVWQAKMLSKCDLYAERLGELHDKLGQLLSRVNYDFPRIALRRRKELGLLDKYLSEFTRNTYESLRLLVEDEEAKFPLNFNREDINISIFSFWGYEGSSAQYSFIDKGTSESWLRSFNNESKYDEDEKLEPKQIKPKQIKPKQIKPKQIKPKQIKPKQIINIKISYWMIERHVMHPIIAHELAHQILKDLRFKFEVQRF